MSREYWFGPKTGFGWGLTPITWQGWAVTLLFIGAILMLPMLGRSVPKLPIIVGASLLYGLVVVLTGTKPGGGL